jgi:septum formation protein
MINEIILASKSSVRKKILEQNKINCIVEASNIDEDSAKQRFLKKKISPEIISKNLAELKANKISQKRNGKYKLYKY